MYNTEKPYKNKVKEIIKSTWTHCHYLTILEGYEYPVFSNHAGLQVDHTDGIGTKGKLHWQQRTFAAAVQDALAMNINDLTTVRAKPYKLQNHLTIPTDDHEAILEIIQELADRCIERKIAMTGGEISVQNNLDGMELSITMTGVIKKPKINILAIGDDLIALQSNGLHANGFTMVKKPNAEPTKIYDFNWDNINGIVHIAGGAFTRLKQYTEGEVVIWNNIKPQEVFKEIREYIEEESMFRTFNCGVGMVLSVNPKYTDKVVEETKGIFFGKIREGSKRVVIESWLGGKEVIL